MEVKVICGHSAVKQIYLLRHGVERTDVAEVHVHCAAPICESELRGGAVRLRVRCFGERDSRAAAPAPVDFLARSAQKRSLYFHYDVDFERHHINKGCRMSARGRIQAHRSARPVLSIVARLFRAAHCSAAAGSSARRSSHARVLFGTASTDKSRVGLNARVSRPRSAGSRYTRSLTPSGAPPGLARTPCVSHPLSH
ncbi:unnamed protein product [Spodoptera exigua]|nr:unnamed protein product [Spodoptera exigua]